MEEPAADSTIRKVGSEEPLLAAVGRRIQQVRKQKKRGVTQTADAAGLKKGHLWRIEAGQHAVTITTLARLAVALDTTMSNLLRGVVVPRPDTDAEEGSSNLSSMGDDPD